MAKFISLNGFTNSSGKIILFNPLGSGGREQNEGLANSIPPIATSTYHVEARVGSWDFMVYPGHPVVNYFSCTPAPDLREDIKKLEYYISKLGNKGSKAKKVIDEILAMDTKKAIPLLKSIYEEVPIEGRKKCLKIIGMLKSHDVEEREEVLKLLEIALNDATSNDSTSDEIQCDVVFILVDYIGNSDLITYDALSLISNIDYELLKKWEVVDMLCGLPTQWISDSVRKTAIGDDDAVDDVRLKICKFFDKTIDGLPAIRMNNEIAQLTEHLENERYYVLETIKSKSYSTAFTIARFLIMQGYLQLRRVKLEESMKRFEQLTTKLGETHARFALNIFLNTSLPDDCRYLEPIVSVLVRKVEDVDLVSYLRSNSELPGAKKLLKILDRSLMAADNWKDFYDLTMECKEAIDPKEWIERASELCSRANDACDAALYFMTMLSDNPRMIPQSLIARVVKADNLCRVKFFSDLFAGGINLIKGIDFLAYILSLDADYINELLWAFVDKDLNSEGKNIFLHNMAQSFTDLSVAYLGFMIYLIYPSRRLWGLKDLYSLADDMQWERFLNQRTDLHNFFYYDKAPIINLEKAKKLFVESLVHSAPYADLLEALELVKLDHPVYLKLMIEICEAMKKAMKSKDINRAANLAWLLFNKDAAVNEYVSLLVSDDSRAFLFIDRLLNQMQEVLKLSEKMLVSRRQGEEERAQFEKLQEEIAGIKSENAKLQSQQAGYENLYVKLSVLESENMQLSEEKTSLEEKNRQLESNYISKQQKVTFLEKKVNKLQEELNEKQEMLDDIRFLSRQDPKGYYTIFGLPPKGLEGIEEDQIQEYLKRQYKFLAQIYHTDKSSGSKRAMQILNAAFVDLSDPDKRRDYNSKCSK